MCGFEHVDSRCGHVSMVLLGHDAQFRFGYRSCQNICLRWSPMYWAYWNFRVCVILFGRLWSHGFFQNWLESLWIIWSLDVLLPMYVNLYYAILNSWFLCS